MASCLAQSTKIFRQSEQRPGQSTNAKGARSTKKSTNAIVSDDSALGADESFDFAGDTPTYNGFGHQRRFEANLQQAGDPIALSVNFLPFRFVKGKFLGLWKLFV
jgi:hypothetical protein